MKNFLKILLKKQKIFLWHLIERQKEKDKLEEQLAIAAVEEQIIKELYPDNNNQATMDKIFNENNIINKEDNNINKINEISPTEEQIIKLKIENEELKKHVDKRGKLIIDLKDRCNEQKNMINELVKKIENIKKFIPENAFKKGKKNK